MRFAAAARLSNRFVEEFKGGSLEAFPHEFSTCGKLVWKANYPASSGLSAHRRTQPETLRPRETPDTNTPSLPATSDGVLAL
jgi:hypothetical protein